jgi:uncharacterized protein
LKLHADPLTRLNAVTAYGPDFVEINRARHAGHLILSPEVPVAAWPVGGFDSLRPEDFELLLEAAPELVLLGTGARQRFPHPRLTVSLQRARVGIEAMDTPAACRTYNILIAEGRRVVAALLLEP